MRWRSWWRRRGWAGAAHHSDHADSGVTSREIWRIAGAADGLEWALFYYAGAAERAGQRYVGAVMASRDGKWPPASEMPAVEAALRRCGIELWEMYEVNNAGCQAPPLVRWQERSPSWPQYPLRT